MCATCVDRLQSTLDAEMLKPIPGPILIHFDDDPCDQNVGVLLTKDEVELGLHASMDENCWCAPFVIKPSDTRTAAEIWEAALSNRSHLT